MKLTKLTWGLVMAAGISLPAFGASLKGTVKMDGSSTVFPLAEAVAEEFGKAEPKVRVTVGLSGSGGGFKKFVAGEIDMSNASRKIKSKEVKAAQARGMKYMEIPVAYDGISVVVSNKNKFAKKLTKAQLKKIWEPGSTVKTWKDVDSSFPAKKIKLYGPGADSGTFDFFTKKVMGKSRRSRSDYVSSEDDNVLVRGISADKYSLGYFGYAYYQANKSKLNLVALSSKGKSFVAPNPKSIEKGDYALSRPLLIYVDLKAAQKPEVKRFVEFFIQNAGSLASEVGYVPLPKSTYKSILANFRKAVKTASAH